LFFQHGKIREILLKVYIYVTLFAITLIGINNEAILNLKTMKTIHGP